MFLTESLWGEKPVVERVGRIFVVHDVNEMEELGELNTGTPATGRR
jgi:hypothetical protein